MSDKTCKPDKPSLKTSGSSGHTSLQIVVPHPAPYRDPVFNTIAKEGEIDIAACYLFGSDSAHSYWDLEHPRYPHHFLGRGLRFSSTCYWHPRIGMQTWGDRCVVVSSGFNHLTNLQLMLSCILTNRPYIFSADTAAADWRTDWRMRLKSWFLRHASGFWVPGKATRNWLEQRGISSDRIAEGCYTLDEEAINKAIIHATHTRSTQRALWGASSNKVVFLMVANLLPKRRHDELLGAFARLSNREHPFVFIVVGAGESIDNLQQKYREALGESLVFLGAQPFDRLAAIYSAADVYIHSGAEPYSTAIQYAAIAGLPIVSSTAVGACLDYVRSQENGMLVAEDSEDSWTATIEHMLAVTAERRAHMGEVSRRIAKSRGVDWASNQLSGLAKQVCIQRYG